MKRTATGRVSVAALLVGVCVSWATPCSAEEPAAEGVRRALLIGINDYRTEEFGDLRGALNDVETMRKILIERFGFQPDNVVLLTDAAATRQGILAALERLVSGSTAQDEVYLHYSGHGSQVKDQNGDEADGLDETILPHDARTESIPDITDDELGGFLRRLQARSVVIVLDSCHSGTATRGGLRTRSVPADTRLELYGSGAVASRALVTDVPEDYVLMTGAASTQSALDGPLDGRFQGFFSYALAQALRDGDVAISPRRVDDLVQQTFTRLSEQFGGLPLPEPQIETNLRLLDRPLFSSTAPLAAAKRPSVEARVDASGALRLLDATVLQAGVGATWAIFPGNETDFAPRRALAQAQVVAIEGRDAVAEADVSLPAQTELRAVVVAPPPPPTRVTARWEQTGDEIRRRLEASVRAKMPDVSFVGPGEVARFVLESDGEWVRVRDAAGLSTVDEFAHDDDDGVAWRLVQLFARSRNASTLLALSNPLAGLGLELRLASGAAKPVVKIRRQDEPRSPDNSLRLELRATADCYVTIIDVDTEGAINVLFPNSYTRDGFLSRGRVPANEWVSIPDSLDEDNQAGFFWDISPPAGLDTILTLATTELETAKQIREWLATAPGVTTRGRGLDQRLATLRDRLHQQIFTRGVSVVPSSSGSAPTTASTPTTTTASNPDWTTASLRLRVEDAAGAGGD